MRRPISVPSLCSTRRSAMRSQLCRWALTVQFAARIERRCAAPFSGAFIERPRAGRGFRSSGPEPAQAQRPRRSRGALAPHWPERRYVGATDLIPAVRCGECFHTSSSRTVPLGFAWLHRNESGWKPRLAALRSMRSRCPLLRLDQGTTGLRHLDTTLRTGNMACVLRAPMGTGTISSALWAHRRAMCRFEGHRSSSAPRRALRRRGGEGVTPSAAGPITLTDRARKASPSERKHCAPDREHDGRRACDDPRGHC
jgi:hypothetical protein